MWCNVPTKALLLLAHLLPETEWSHVGPDFVDVREAVGLLRLLAGLAPTGRDVAIGRPDRVLLLVVHHDLEQGLLVIEGGSRHLPCF